VDVSAAAAALCVKSLRSASSNSYVVSHPAKRALWRACTPRTNVGERRSRTSFSSYVVASRFEQTVINAAADGIDWRNRRAGLHFRWEEALRRGRQQGWWPPSWGVGSTWRGRRGHERIQIRAIPFYLPLLPLLMAFRTPLRIPTASGERDGATSVNVGERCGLARRAGDATCAESCCMLRCWLAL
jgi:hypothetical protein